MATEHWVFQPPAARDVPLWRYMDFTKFVDMLERRQLFFARADNLGDPFEGSLSVLDHAQNQRLPPGTADNVRLHNEWVREWTFVSCWHANEDESAAMWKLYSSGKEAIAIRTTYVDLFGTLPENVFLGTVRYVDYATTQFPRENTFFPFVHKRRSFAHEREVRAVCQELPTVRGLRNTGGGRYVDVDLAKLIHGIYVAPGSADWFWGLTQAVVRKYELSHDVSRSSLDEAPLF